MRVVRVLYGRVSEQVGHPALSELADDLMVVINTLGYYTEHFDCLVLGDTIQDTSACVSQMIYPPLPCVRLGTPGRPPYRIDRDIIESMSDLGFTFENMARILGISSRTLRCHRHELGFPIGQDRFNALSNEQLDEQITNILRVSTFFSETVFLDSYYSNDKC